MSYTRQERFAGESHYPLGKMLGFAATVLQTTADQSVRVMFSERGEADRVVLRERSGP